MKLRSPIGQALAKLHINGSSYCHQYLLSRGATGAPLMHVDVRHPVVARAHLTMLQEIP